MPLLYNLDVLNRKMVQIVIGKDVYDLGNLLFSAVPGV